VFSFGSPCPWAKAKLEPDEPVRVGLGDLRGTNCGGQPCKLLGAVMTSWLARGTGVGGFVGFRQVRQIPTFLVISATCGSCRQKNTSRRIFPSPASRRPLGFAGIKYAKSENQKIWRLFLNFLCRSAGDLRRDSAIGFGRFALRFSPPSSRAPSVRRKGLLSALSRAITVVSPTFESNDMHSDKAKFVAYYRVSTERQGQSGLGLEAQRAAVQAYLNGRVCQLIAEVTEIESGKRSDRPKLAEASRICRLHGASLIIAKLDRLARNVAFVSSLMESGVEFVAVDFPQANRLTVHILAAVAEHEAKAISERTKAALQAAKARGKTLGGYRGVNPNEGARRASLARRQASAKERAADLAPVISQMQAEGIVSLNGLARELTARGIPTARGGTKWAPSQVARVLKCD
jgi:DNA invertase Pin-like site-specific DNA recombinase